MARRIWWQRPVLRTDAEEDRDRKVTWLELFFDLYFVVVVAEVAHSLAKDISWAGFGQYIFLFLHLWWVWIGHTYYNERFETEGFENRLFTFLLMIPTAGLAVFTHHALSDTSIPFALSYALARVIITFLWWRGGYHDHRFRPTANRFTFGFILSIMLFGLSVFVPPPQRFVMWTMGLLIDLITPFFTLEHQTQLPRLGSSKLPERFGLFIIIVLGESVVGIISGLAERDHFSPMAGLTALLGMALAFGIWWIYFDFINRRPPKPQTGWAFTWGYLHMPLTLSIAAIGAGILNILAHDDPTVPLNLRILLAWSVAAVLIIMALLETTLQRATDEPTHPYWSPGLKLGGAAIALGLGILPQPNGVVSFLSSLLFLLLIQMGYGLYVWFTQELVEG